MIPRKIRWKIDTNNEKEDRERFNKYLEKLKKEGEKVVNGSIRENNKIITFELENAN